MPSCIVNKINRMSRRKPKGLSFLDWRGYMIPYDKEYDGYDSEDYEWNPDSDDNNTTYGTEYNPNNNGADDKEDEDTELDNDAKTFLNIGNSMSAPFLGVVHQTNTETDSNPDTPKTDPKLKPEP